MNPYALSPATAAVMPAPAQRKSALMDLARGVFNSQVSSFSAVLLLGLTAGAILVGTLVVKNQMAKDASTSGVSLNVPHHKKTAVYAIFTDQQVLGASTSAPRVNQIISIPGTRTIYLVGQSGLYGFPDPAIFYSWGYNFLQVLPANTAEETMLQVGVVPARQTGCTAIFDQLSGKCGNGLVTLPNQTMTAPRAAAPLSFSPNSS